MNCDFASPFRRVDSVARAVLYSCLSAPMTMAYAAETNTLALEEVIVTATKRAESVRDIPASIVAFNAEALEARGVQSVADIAKLVPGVNLTKPGDSALRVTIRGIASEAGTNPTAGTLFEDTSFSDAYLPRVTLDPHPFDLASVEVLKGPQGTLFGAGALNGMIRYVPEYPQFGVWQAKYFAQYIGFSQGSAGLAYGAVLNAPLGSTDELALRLMAFDRKTPGYVDNLRTGRDDANEQEQAGARGILSWHPTEDFSARLLYAWQQTRDDDSSTTDNTSGNLSVSNRPRPSPAYSKYALASLQLNYQFSLATLVSETAYVEKRATSYFDNSSRLLPGGTFPILAQADRSDSETWSQELRFVSNGTPADPWRWVAGAFASRQDVTYAASYRLGDPSLPIATAAGILNLAGLGDLWLVLGRPNYVDFDTDVRVEELAAFADVTRRLGDKWELSAGGRVYQTTSGGVARQSGLLLYAVGLNGAHALDKELREEGFNPKVSLSWHVTGAALLYGTVSRGFRVGGVQPLLTTPLNPVPAPDTFKSDSIWNYEIGARTQWLDDTLQLDLTAFLEKWKDPQTLQFDRSGLTTYIDNVGGVESKGAEAALQYAFPLPGLLLSAAATYTDATTTESYTASDGTVLPAGARWPLSPTWQTAATLAYMLDVGDWTLGSSVVYTDLGEAVYGLRQAGKIFGYHQWDVRFTLANPANKLLPKLTLEGTNLGDERGITNSFSGASYTDATYLQPRAITLRLTGEF